MNQESVVAKMLEASEKYLHIKLDMNDVSSLLSISKIQMYLKGQTIIGINEKLTHMGFVLNGIVRSYYLDMDGNEITKNFHKESYLLMDEGLIGYDRSICPYETLEGSAIILFDVVKLRSMIQNSEKLKDMYIAALESGIKYKLHRENEFLMNNATKRYLQFEKDYPELVDRVKQAHISTYLGITPESLSRIKKALNKTSDMNGGKYE